MAKCKVYFYTYKRNHLLPRAIQSLVGQTFEDWICEVHNDCPEDMFPSIYLQSLSDPRFIIKNHEINLGSTVSFNLAFTFCEEEYVSILEDDNWWEPDFLQEMIHILDNNPNINIAWSNMRIWKENIDDQWENTNQTIWPAGGTDTLFYWPDYKQAMGALHSIGAMLFRSKNAKKYSVPDTCDVSIIEGVRERAFEFPIYFTGKILANFSLTLQTARSNDPLFWTCSQMMLLGSFIQATSNQKKTFKETLAYHRKRKPSPVANFFLIIIFILKAPSLIKYFNLKDWFYISKWLLKNCLKFSRLKSHLKSQRDVYECLLVNTINRNKEISIKDQPIGI